MSNGMRHWLCREAHLLFTVVKMGLLVESSSTIRIETDAMSGESLEYIPKGFPGTRYFPKFKLTTWHPKGVLDQSLADKLVVFIEWEEYIQAAPFLLLRGFVRANRDSSQSGSCPRYGPAAEVRSGTG